MSPLRWIMFAFVIIGIAAPADACPGLLCRLFGLPPRVACAPAPTVPPVAKAEVKTPESVATLRGRVTFPNAPLPKYYSPLQLARNDRLLGDMLIAAKEKDLLDQGPIVNPRNFGLKNAVVFLRRPDGIIWPIDDADKIRKDPLVIDAPLAAFDPHVAALYAEWFDGKNRGKTGQRCLMRNTSPYLQNYRAFGNPKFNDGFNINLPPQTEQEVAVQPQLLPILLVDDFYFWKKAYVFVFDHPYFAITNADGEFSIPRVPAGMQLKVMAWHEEVGWLLGKEGRSVTFHAGKNVLDIATTVR